MKHFPKWLATMGRHLRPVVGLPLIYIGVVLLCVFYALGLTNYNVLLFLPLVLVIVGIAGRIMKLKS